MEVIRVLTVHREASTRARLRRFLEFEPGIDLVGELADTVNAAPFIRVCQPQLVFLEVPYQDDYVVPMLERISDAFPPLIVFVSAYNDYAVHAFEISALDYLLEPFTNDRFKLTLTRARERMHEHQIIAHSDWLLHLLPHHLKPKRRTSGSAAPAAHEERLVVKTGNRLIFLDIEDVDWIKSEGVYVRLHVGGKSYLLRESLQNVEARLQLRQFIRIHRSTIVNVRRIKEIVPHTNGGGIVRLHDGAKFKLSRSYRNRVNATLG